MPNRAQINRYIINHGVKDQLLAMFDQTLKSNRFFSKTFDQADPWYVKSLVDLTYLIRHMVSDAVKEHMTLLSPLETKRIVDQEIVKLYWHFFSAQQIAYDNINERYKGIGRLKTISFIINKANFCIKNPNNINANLKLVGFDEWGDSFLTLNSSTESLDLLIDELDHLLTFKASLSHALNETKAFRAEQKIIKDKEDLSKTFAQKLSKGLKVKSLLDELDEKIDALEQSIEDDRSVVTNKISSDLKDAGHARLDASEDYHLISDSDEEYEYDYDNYDVTDIDVTKVDPRLKMLLDISAHGVYQSDSSNIEHQLLALLEGAFGFKLIDLHVENFNELTPLLMDALETSNLSKIEMYLANAYPKKLSPQNDTNLHPELVKSMLWPSAIKKDSSQTSMFDEVLSFFNEGTKFKRSRETSDFILSKLVKRKEMTHFYHFYAQKMCSFTPELSGFPEQSYKSIRFEKVEKRFKACTADLVFKFASLAEVLKCDQLSKEEIEDLGVQVEKTIIFLNRTGQVNPYDFIAKWSLKRLHRLNNKTTDFVKDKKQLDMFLALYASDFECVDSQFMNFFQADGVSEAKHSKTRQKLDLIGGFDNLANKSQMMEIVNSFGMQNKHELSSRLNDFLDQIYIDQKSEETSNELKIKNVKNIMERCYKASQSLTDNSKMFLSRYALLAYKFSHKSKYTSHQDALVTQFIKLNERIFNKPIYQFSDKLISNLSGFIKNNNINYKGWQSLLRGLQISNDGGRYIDIFALFEIQSQESETLAAAVDNTLNWIESSSHEQGGLAQLTYVEKNIKNYSDRYGLLIEEAKQIKQFSFKSPKPARIFPLSRTIVAENHSSDFKRSNELGKDVIMLVGKLAEEMGFSLRLNLVKLLETKSYDSILDLGLLPSVKKIFHDHAKSIVSDAVKNMSESERLLKEVGYESDFSDEDIEDLPSYQVFFNAMLPHLKEKHLLDLLSTDETKKFSPKTLRDTLVLKEKALMKSIEKQQKIVDDAKSKNRVASDLANELRLIFLAFDAVSKERSVENINLAEAISISGVAPDADRAMMIRLMSSLKEVDLINEPNLSSVISILKLVEKIKSVGLNEKDEILSQLGKEGYDQGGFFQQRLFTQFSQMKKSYHGIDKYSGNVSETDLRDEFFVFIDAVKVLRENSIEDQEIFLRTAKDGLFRLPLTDLLDAIDDDAVIHLVKTLGQNSREANEVRNSLGKEKLASLYNALYTNTDGFVDVDLNSEEDIAVSEKTLFFLSQHYPDIYDDLIKKHLYKNVRHMMRHLEIVYLDYLLEKADANLSQAKKAHDPSRMSTETALVAATQEKAMLDSVKNFCINGSSEMFFTTLSYLLPKNDNRKLLDQLIYQFAPSWGYELSIDKNKEIIDMSLSTQLLAHHGAAKLFNNNLNYHMPKEVADISMLISLVMLVVSIVLSWSSVAIGVLAATFAASIFMKVCVMHNREMALKPYSIYDRLGLMESIEQVKSIWVKYDNEESIIIIKMLENFELLNDTESLHSYDGQFSKRINQIDLVKLAEFEKSMKIEVSSQTSIANRVISVFSKQPSILSKKLFLKQIDMRSNVALSSAALENAQKLFDHIKEEDLSDIKENKQMRQLLVSFLHKEHPNFSQKRLVALSDFIFEGNQDDLSFKAKDPLDGFAVDDVAKFLSNMQAIKKVKAQLEDFSKHDESFPTHYELKRIPDIHVEDVRLMEKKGVTCFADLEKLIDPSDFTGKSLYSCEYNNGVRDIISDYMKSSGDNIRMTSKIKPMSMFGCIKIEDKDGEEDQLQSSFSIGVAEVPLST